MSATEEEIADMERRYGSTLKKGIRAGFTRTINQRDIERESKQIARGMSLGSISEWMLYEEGVKKGKDMVRDSFNAAGQYYANLVSSAGIQVTVRVRQSGNTFTFEAQGSQRSMVMLRVLEGGSAGTELSDWIGGAKKRREIKLLRDETNKDGQRRRRTGVGEGVPGYYVTIPFVQATLMRGANGQLKAVPNSSRAKLTKKDLAALMQFIATPRGFSEETVNQTFRLPEYDEGAPQDLDGRYPQRLSTEDVSFLSINSTQGATKRPVQILDDPLASYRERYGKKRADTMTQGGEKVLDKLGRAAGASLNGLRVNPLEAKPLPEYGAASPDLSFRANALQQSRSGQVVSFTRVSTRQPNKQFQKRAPLPMHERPSFKANEEAKRLVREALQNAQSWPTDKETEPMVRGILTTLRSAL